MLGNSRNIGNDYYEKAKKFLADLVSHFTVGEENVRVGLVNYGDNPDLTFDLHAPFDKDEIVKKLQSAEYLPSSIATGDAISFMTDTGFTEDHGMRPLHHAVPCVALVLTDGKSDGDATDVLAAAEAAKDKHIEIHAFGVGNGVDDDELLTIAGRVKHRVHMIDNFGNINDAMALISRSFCQGKQLAYMCMRYLNDIKYFSSCDG